MYRIAKFFRNIAIAYLLLLAGFTWGYFTFQYKIFPFHLISSTFTELVEFVQGHPEEKSTLTSKIASELRTRPDRFLSQVHKSFALRSYPGLQEYVFSPRDLFHASYERLPVILTKREHGFYLLYGIYGLKSNSQAFSPTALLVDAKGRIARTWNFPFVDKARAPRRLTISREGILVSNSSGVLRAQNWCGKALWENTHSFFHHEIYDSSTEFLLWADDAIVAVDKFTGSTKTITDMRTLVLRNPDFAPFRSRLKDNWRYGQPNTHVLFDSKSKRFKKKNLEAFIGDSFHQNGVARNDGASHHFPADFLLLSFRNIDIVAIIDPSTSRIHWHRWYNRQHDPRWERDGITVYNNRTNFLHSEIVYSDFRKKTEKPLVDARSFRFYRARTGNHEILEDGSILFQAYGGQTVHLDASGAVETIIWNLFSENQVLKHRNAFFLTSEFVDRRDSECES